MVINGRVREITHYKAFAMSLRKTTAIDKVLPANGSSESGALAERRTPKDKSESEPAFRP
jgi:ASC-1-like (ASCH) protein